LRYFIFSPEGEGNRYFQNVGIYLSNYRT
jgi:hypothetical protein